MVTYNSAYSVVVKTKKKKKKRAILTIIDVTGCVYFLFKLVYIDALLDWHSLRAQTGSTLKSKIMETGIYLSLALWNLISYWGKEK